ncbi:hypothetical protein [Rodentibacter trehalosifermentans]|uniref:Uncharacterized protein n=1 Tax=Rodentibacter trehalosifermentans TaxID=1908263 RepID=A0A1V3J2Z2_9PAST|nr:hypothetical protein [Rodentibacter trehalosifermentans]OOF47200.1 hypothetical protein BKK51_00620 [Rodentibacter trehalosifermentans]OOF49476.1 hypothetical protein BKK52_02895 [Rodentibacter trehalosifermentans]OOF52460.1 hypothetical protein BKK53_05020 [Rodentibacter trehalosifermentans]
MKKDKENPYVFAVFIAIFTVTSYFYFFHFEQGIFEKITNIPLIVTCTLLIYVIYLIIFLFSNNPYSTSAPKYSFRFIVNFLLFWGLPILEGYMLANSIAIYYTGNYGKLEPISIAQITDKEKITGGKGGSSYYLYLYNNLLPSLRISRESYEKAQIKQCVEIQYRTSFLGIYRDYWKFTKCPDKFSQNLYQPSYNYIDPALFKKEIPKNPFPQRDILDYEKSDLIKFLYNSPNKE